MNKKICMELKNIRRSYGKKENVLDVLTDVNLTLHAGEIVALVGPSGSGKSTLLHIAGLLDTPSAGHIIVNGTDVSRATDKQRTLIRRKAIGFVYQSHLLLPDFNALENVMLPQLIAGASVKEAKERATLLLEQVGLSDRLLHRSGELSGGEQQRVAIARALANQPSLLLADEPTGNLDPKTSETVFAGLLNIVRQTGLSALIATHNPDLARQMDRQVTVQNGRLVELNDKKEGI
ncbi:MAG: ABC transporter ATP-binding protein [Alphaproteobacteria bacterium]|nr:ABC transporter ATP-binding protein [Alphaproteobacteria bacterium]MBQ6853994.1 ABC transporter ATP-binding protein [Alphaproteobacteria bacterium]